MLFQIALTKEHLIAVSTEGNVEVYGIGKESTGSLKVFFILILFTSKSMSLDRDLSLRSFLPHFCFH